MNIALILLAAGNSRRFGANKLLYEVDGRPMYLHTLEKMAGIAAKWSAVGAHCPNGCAPAAADCAKAGLTDKAQNSVQTFLTFTVVTQYETIGEAAKSRGAAVYFNPRPWEGISSSLKIGLKANQDADFALFAVADQPRLLKETLENILNAALLSGRGMACAAYGEHWGNPCSFSKRYFPELLALNGDRGGKKILLAHPEDVTPCQVSSAEELADIDTPEKLKNML